MSSHAKLFPRLKYLAKSQSDTIERNISIVYILTVCVYLISDPFTLAPPYEATAKTDCRMRRSTMPCSNTL